MDGSDSAAAAEGVRPRSAFRHRAYLLYWLSRFAATFATQIISVAIGWQVYDLTRDPFDLGIVGLVQFLPSLALVLVTGATADRFNRRLIIALCLAGEAAVCLALIGFTFVGLTAAWPIFAVLLCFGVARAFFGPASASLLPN